MWCILDQVSCCRINPINVPSPPSRHVWVLADLCETKPGWCFSPSQFWLVGYLTKIIQDASESLVIYWKTICLCVFVCILFRYIVILMCGCARHRDVTMRRMWKVNFKKKNFEYYLPCFQTLPLQSLFWQRSRHSVNQPKRWRGDMDIALKILLLSYINNDL